MDIEPYGQIMQEYRDCKSPEDSTEFPTSLASPIILVSKGGGGSRLLSVLAGDFGVFLGNEINTSGDCLDMVEAVYKGVMEKYGNPAGYQSGWVISRLRRAAADMLARADGNKTKLWGFKLPETLFLLPEIQAAFPEARYVQMFRNPIDICLRRTHLTARMDTKIGGITLPLAYRSLNRPVEMIDRDSPAIHMAYTTLHQLRLILDFFGGSFGGDKSLELYFEDLIRDPKTAVGKFGIWLSCPPVSTRIIEAIDINRALNPTVNYPAEVVDEVVSLLAPLNKEIGYV